MNRASVRLSLPATLLIVLFSGSLASGALSAPGGLQATAQDPSTPQFAPALKLPQVSDGIVQQLNVAFCSRSAHDPTTQSAWQEAGFSVAASPDGSRVFVTGETYPDADAGQGDYLTVAYDAASGAILWMKTYDGPGHDQDHANALVVSYDGSRVYVIGWSRGAGTGNDYAIIAYDAASGTPFWDYRYDGVGDDDYGFTLVLTRDDRTLYATGWSTGEGSGLDFLTFALTDLDQSVPTRIWLDRYDGPQHRTDRPYLIALSPDESRLIVEGEEGGTQSLLFTGIRIPAAQNWAVIAYETPNGARNWTQHWNGQGTSNDFADDVVVTEDGQVLVTGWDNSLLDSWQFLMISYRLDNGEMNYANWYDTPGRDFSWQSVLSPDGRRIFLAGSGGDRPGDYLTVAWNTAQGSNEPAWVRQYDGGGRDSAWSIDVSPDGELVFVTGCSQGGGDGGDFDMATVAYKASDGEQRWANRFEQQEGRNDGGWFVTATRDRVFTTGWSALDGRSNDLTTLAYEPRSGEPLWSSTVDHKDVSG